MLVGACVGSGSRDDEAPGDTVRDGGGDIAVIGDGGRELPGDARSDDGPEDVPGDADADANDGTADVTVDSPTDATLDTRDGADRPDLDAGDAAPPDTGSADATPDAGPCTAHGCTCESGDDCESGYCVVSGDGDRGCAQLCTDLCDDPRLDCYVVRTAAGDAVRLCTSDLGDRCDTCEVHGDCAGDAACVSSADGAFCAPRCVGGDLCPTGTACQRTDVDGAVRDLCVPEIGACSACGVGSVPNECGGCTSLGAPPLTPCGTCGSGVWVCNGTDGVMCAGDEGEDARNACDGCDRLDATPGTACGECGGGTWTCDSGDAVRCEGGDAPMNACDGCAALAGRPGDPCGTCDSGAWRCASGEHVICDGDRGDEARNACGGCGTLSGSPGDPCGECGDGVVACGGVDTLLCLGDDGDDDGDGVCNEDDRCPGGDDRDDADRDTVPDACDACSVGDDRNDADRDGVPDLCDCDSARCHARATCREAESGAVCTCITGYDGDGRTCSDINECATGGHDCHRDASCENAPGTFTCDCNPGFTGDGRACTDIDECRSGAHGCDINATCTNTRGDYDCTCNIGYDGTGWSCTLLTEWTFHFPSLDDTFTGARPDGSIDAAGAIYTGTRDIPLPQISAVSGATPVLDANNLCPSGGEISFTIAVMALRINGEQFGSLIFGPAEPSFFAVPEAPPPATPPYTIELESFVPSCGSYNLSETESTITVVP